MILGIPLDSHAMFYTWIPRITCNDELPVLVYFHGGAYMFGVNTVINGAEVASTQNIIVISSNYRLGVFGFFFHPEFQSKMAPNITLQSMRISLILEIKLLWINKWL